MHHYTTVHLYDGDTFRRGPDTNVPYLSVDSPTEYGAITLHFGAGAALSSPTLAIAQLDGLLAAAAELRNDLAASIGRAPVVIVPVGPDGPDDPTDDPTDEPATLCGVAGGFDGVRYRCSRELGHDGQHEDWTTESPITYQWHDWSVPVAVQAGSES